ncbi:MAG: lytic transglycosylase domain-containing protein [Bdellovibrionales bacterium]|nr:lytic transglycosylase domain-containing protein [Bdellovibrionales bacterium]
MKRNLYQWAIVVLLLCGTGFAVAKAVDVAEGEGTLESSEETSDTPVSEEVMPAETGPAPVATPLNPKWSATDFAKQEQALGWTPAAFEVPAGMEERVQFWKDIYTKYSSEQGVLHDSKYVHLMYDNLDFSDITARQDLTHRQKEKARRNRVDEKKKEVMARMKRLSELKSGEGLEGEDARYWEMFAKVDEPKKFAEAAKKGRLRFQLGQRDIFMRGIYQSGRYLRQMEEIFRAEGLPIELTRLPFVESSFNLKARSRVGASGIWQFMRSTARLYMRMDGSADERNDPLRATRAAAKKLRDNYTMLKSWPLAVTAYNHGPAGVRRLTESMGTTDIVELIDVRKGRFKFASASFFASFLAALDVERNADKNFGVLEVMPELRGAEIPLVKNQNSKDFMKWFNNDVEMAKTLNPHVADSVWKGRAPLSRKHILRVPLMQEQQARGEMQ